MTSRWFSFLVFAVALLGLSSCYVPDKFQAELLLSRYGDYALKFSGDLIYLPIQHDYAEGNIKTPEEDAQRQDDIKRDLSRDRAFTEITALGKGRFHVKYVGPVRGGRAGGRMGPDELVSIIRRDAHMLRMKSHPDNQIVIAADSLKPADAEAMAKVGLGMTGEFRLTTDGNVIDHNATEVRTMGISKVYIWKIDNPLSPMPHAVMIRDVDPTRLSR